MPPDPTENARSPFQIRRLMRDYAALTAGEIVSKLAGFLAFAYLARTLAPSRYGLVELAVAIHMVGFLVVDFGLAPIGARAIAADPSRATALGRQIPALRLLLSLFAYASMLICTLSLGRNDALPLVALYGVSLLCSPWKLNWLLQGLDLVLYVGPAQLIYMVAFAVGVVVFVSGPSDLLRVGVVEIGAALAMASYFVAVGRRHVRDLRPLFDLGALHRLLAEAAPVGLSQLMWAINQYGPTLLVAGLLASDEIAYFGAAHRIVISLGSFVFLYFFNIYPSLVRTTSHETDRFERSMQVSFRFTIWVGAWVCLVGTLLSAEICRIVYGDEFGPAGELLGLLIWVLPISLASGHARFSLLASGRQRLELAAQTLGVVVTVSLCLALVPRLGIRGAALAMLVSAASVWAAAHVGFTRSVAKLPSLGALLRPAVGLGAAWSGASAIHFASPWRASLAASAMFLAAGLLLELPFLRTLAHRRDGGQV